MKDRILQVRKWNKMTQDSFAEQLGLSKNFVWMLEKGERVPSDRTISDICTKIKIDGDSINPEWLKYGIGKPTIKKSRSQEVATFMNDIMELPDENIKKRLIEALAKLNESDWNTIAKIAEGLKGGEE